MLWGGKKDKLERLFGELRGIAVLERLYDTRTNPTENDLHARAMRQIRQSELMAEIERLTTKKGGPYAAR